MTPQLDPVDALAQLAFLVHGTLERRAAAHDLSLVQSRLLGILRDRRPTMNELATLLNLDKSSVSGLVDRAERRGLVARQPSDVDRRSIQVTLTRAGRALTTTVAAQFGADVQNLLSALPAAQRRALSTLAGTIVVSHAAERGIDLFRTAP